MQSSIKQKIHFTLNQSIKEKHKPSKIDLFLMWLILINLILTVPESYMDIDEKYGTYFRAFEWFSIAIFSLEYICRMYVADLNSPETSPFKARLKYATSFYGVIDILTIIPVFIPYVVMVNTCSIKLLRLFRIIRIMKLNRHSKSLQLFSDVLKDSKQDIFTTLFLFSLLILVAANLLYEVESIAQPDVFTSIGQAFWCAIATLTTLGYGDIYPVTSIGKVICGCIALLGIGIVAIPTAIVSSSFIRLSQEHKQQQKDGFCPTCGQKHQA